MIVATREKNIKRVNIDTNTNTNTNTNTQHSDHRIPALQSTRRLHLTTSPSLMPCACGVIPSASSPSSSEETSSTFENDTASRSNPM